MKNLFILAVVFLSLVLSAQELKVGLYEVKGMDLTKNEAYDGECFIMKPCEDFYAIGYKFSDGTMEGGVGVLKEGKLLIIFQNADGVDYGYQVSTIKEDGSMTAEWKLFNRECNGNETLTFKEMPEGCNKKEFQGEGEVKVGMYDVKGMDLAKNEAYQGQCFLMKPCEHFYGIKWVFTDGDKEGGIAVLKEHQLLIVFQNANGIDYGYMVADVKGNDITGVWKMLNRECNGSETMTFKGKPECPKDCKCEGCQKACDKKQCPADCKCEKCQKACDKKDDKKE